MTYPPPGGTPPPGFGQQPQQPGYPQQQGGYNPQQPGYGAPQQPGGYTPAAPGGYNPAGAPGGYQQPGYGGPGAPPPGPGAPPPIPPPSGGGNGGLVAKILGAVGSIVLIAVIALVKVFVFDSDDGGGDDYAGDTTLSSDEEEAAEKAVEGDCMPQNYGSGVGEEIVVDCGGEQAFWTITKVDNDAAVSITNGDVTDFQDAVDICGENVYARIPGEVWLDYNFVELEGTTEQFFCLEAIQEENADGQLPKTPDAGECFDDSDDWWTVDCSSPNAVYEAVDAVQMAPPTEMTESEAESDLVSQCSGGESWWQVQDQVGRTGGVICGVIL